MHVNMSMSSHRENEINNPIRNYNVIGLYQTILTTNHVVGKSLSEFTYIMKCTALTYS